MHYFQILVPYRSTFVGIPLHIYTLNFTIIINYYDYAYIIKFNGSWFMLVIFIVKMTKERNWQYDYWNYHSVCNNSALIL